MCSLALHPNQQVVATGQVGDNPMVCVWDTTGMHTISILHGTHTKGIATVSFGGPDGKVGYVVYTHVNAWGYEEKRENRGGGKNRLVTVANAN